SAGSGSLILPRAKRGGGGPAKPVAGAGPGRGRSKPARVPQSTASHPPPPGTPRGERPRAALRFTNQRRRRLASPARASRVAGCPQGGRSRMRLWLKNPLAILAEGAGGGVVVADGRIAELVPSGRQPSAPVD